MVWICVHEPLDILLFKHAKLIKISSGQSRVAKNRCGTEILFRAEGNAYDRHNYNTIIQFFKLLYVICRYKTNDIWPYQL
ncbi:hypothetical protein AR158_c148L [Paramecium bursaria Chlorella virus AR158]|uniref:hypothetical protein n=1 Tax=Paramecium bursaria Chlorella virus AR158 TaxID=380598 RepID=UPI00015AA7F3|nr:hypothetical protein AR158_c148L [Paramecium bursaria Chlorella virus AR158]ABU43694.1 hypothetical protein AR158_c148L [Paramecium bursaria Chlorella virus AR158]